MVFILQSFLLKFKLLHVQEYDVTTFYPAKLVGFLHLAVVPEKFLPPVATEIFL